MWNMFLKYFKSNIHKCDFKILHDSTDEHYYLRHYEHGFNMCIYQYSLELYKCCNCGKVKRKKFKWVTLPNTGKSFYLN